MSDCLRTLKITCFLLFLASQAVAQETSVQPTCVFTPASITTKVELSEPLRSTDQISIQCNDDRVRVQVTRDEQKAERIVDLDPSTTDAPRVVSAIVVELLRKPAPPVEPIPATESRGGLLETGLLVRTLSQFSSPTLGIDLGLYTCSECRFFFGASMDVAWGSFDREPGTLRALTLSAKPTIGIRAGKRNVKFEGRVSPILGWIRVSPDSIPGETSDGSFFWRAIAASFHAAYELGKRSRLSGYFEFGGTLFPLTALNEVGDDLNVSGVFVASGIRYGFTF